MQQSYVLSEAVSSINNLATAINSVLAQTAMGWGPWQVVTSFATTNEVYVVFIRNAIPATGGSPYVVT